jgi:hypothetical protein
LKKTVNCTNNIPEEKKDMSEKTLNLFISITGAQGTVNGMPLRVFNAQETMICRRCFLMNDNNKTGKKNNSSDGLPMGMCIGIAIGTAVGAATHNLGIWLPVGLCLGLALAPALGHKKTDDNENGRDDQQ